MEQIAPASQCTPEQGFLIHVGEPPRATQTSSEAQLFPAQGSGGMQLVAHAKPCGQVPSQAVYGTQVPFWHELPALHVTPAHGVGKQPGTQVPFSQVLLAGHETPAHRSVIAMQVA